ncbi:exported hypothetical protein [Paraburkholderia tropica]
MVCPRLSYGVSCCVCVLSCCGTYTATAMPMRKSPREKPSRGGRGYRLIKTAWGFARSFLRRNRRARTCALPCAARYVT